MTNVEKHFKETVKKAHKEINECLRKASAELSKAVQISEKTGIPFDSNISFLGQVYTPETFVKKWPKVVEEIEKDSSYDVFDFCVESPSYGGWAHSDIC